MKIVTLKWMARAMLIWVLFIGCGYRVHNIPDILTAAHLRDTPAPIFTLTEPSRIVFKLQPVAQDKPRYTSTVTDSTTIKLTGIVASQAQELKLFHDRAIIAADRRYAEKVKQDSLLRVKDAIIAAQADTIKQQRAERLVQEQLTNFQVTVAKYLPLFAGLFMIIGGAAVWLGWLSIERFNYKRPTL